MATTALQQAEAAAAAAAKSADPAAIAEASEAVIEARHQLSSVEAGLASGGTVSIMQEMDEKTKSNTQAERDILTKIRSKPFLVHLHYAFQTEDKLNLILDYVCGGDMVTHLWRYRQTQGRCFSETDAALYTAEIALALGTLHELGIIYRDLKLENILMDAKGHLVLTDFGLSTEAFQTERSGRVYSYVGTIEYMAPEVLGNDGYTKSADWWSLGVLIYELIYGFTPFVMCTAAQKQDPEFKLDDHIAHNIYYKEPDYGAQHRSRFGKGGSDLLIDLLTKLLAKVPEERLGHGPADLKELKRHRESSRPLPVCLDHSF